MLLLTRPNDYVMDAKGDYVFRPRPIYWVIETLTRARMNLGRIKDTIPESLASKRVQMCYLITAHIPPATSQFILANYMPFDPQATDLGVAGKKLGPASPDGTFLFNVAIPATYAVVSESGTTAGTLDGAPYGGPVPLAVGHHIFHRTSGGGRAAIFLARALDAGFHPLFDASEKIIAQEQARTDK